MNTIKQNVEKFGGITNAILRFSIQWNDLGDYDHNDLDAHCIEPNGFEILCTNKCDTQTGGSLDVDVVNPNPNEAAVENIYWKDINKMPEGTYRFFVHNYAYRDGHSGFRAEIEFEDQIYYYDYRKTISNKSNIDVACVTLANGSFTIEHMLPFERLK